jgi:hypothetical protein
MRPLAFLVLGAAVTAVSCVEPRPTAPGAVPIEHLAPAPAIGSNLREPARLVVEDETAWAEIWARAFGAGDAAPPRPSVDFARERVLVVALGERTSGGFSILVEGVLETSGGYVARVVSTAPGPRCAVITMMTQPVDVVRLPRAKGKVVFEERAKVDDCAAGGGTGP